MSNVHTRSMSILTSFRENLIFFVDNEMHRSSYRFSIQHDIYFASYRIFECSKTLESIVNLLPVIGDTFYFLYYDRYLSNRTRKRVEF